MDLLKEEVKDSLNFKDFDIYISRLDPKAIGTHSGFYFYDDTPKIHVNHYPNINISYDDHYLDLTYNSETRSSVRQVLATMKNNPDRLDAVLKKLPDLKLLIFYKLQYRPMDNFVWDLVPGFPKDVGSFKSSEIIKEINSFENQWDDFRRTVLYQMESGRVKHASGRLFNEKELIFARNNPRPNYAIRFGKQYSAEQMAAKEKKIVQFFKKQIAELKHLAELVLIQ